MGRRTASVIRSIGVVVTLLLAIGLTQRPALAAAAVAVSPTSGPIGTTVLFTGSGFGASQSVNIYFGSTYGGVVTSSASGTFSVSFAVPAVSPGVYNVAAASMTASASTPFTVTGSASGLVLQKTVSVNGLGYGGSGNAMPGDTLTYKLTVTNNTGGSVSGIVIRDPLEAGQTPVSTPAPCSYSAGTNTVNCTPGAALTNGNSATYYFSVVVTGGFAGTIPNTAYVSSTGFTERPSNTTVVAVSGGFVTATPALELCGVVSAYVPPNSGLGSPGSITIGGVTVSLGAHSVFSGTPIGIGQNLCILLSTTSGGLSAVSVAANLTGLSLACGVYTPSASGLTVGGVHLLVGGLSTIVFASLVPGTSYCFLLSGGVAYAVLSLTPTSIVFPAHTAVRGGHLARML